MKYEEIVHRCFRCGYCKLTGNYGAYNCPSYRKFFFETYSPGGRMWLIRAWLQGEIDASERFQEILFSCATCANCAEHCIFPFRDDLVNIFVAAREEMVKDGKILPSVRNYFRSIQQYGNPYKARREDRENWAKGMSIERYDGHDYLLYIGCVGSYDERGQKIVQAVGELLTRGGVSFGILGADEMCDGNEVRALGEASLFEILARQNISLFKDRGIAKIITLDPHAFNTFRNDYPLLGADVTVFHYTQILEHLLTSGRLSVDGYAARMTYHDPCYLGRYNGLFDIPRKILESIPGVSLIEMEQNRKDAFCCGGGGGNFFTDVLGGGDESPSRVRVRQAAAIGAEVIAVSCPQCARMLGDAVRAEGQDRLPEVLDIAELVLQAIA